MTDQSTCRACGKPMRWVVMALSGKLNPLDPEPVPNGNIQLRDGKGVYVGKRTPIEAGEPRYVSHFATCPEARRFRKAS